MGNLASPGKILVVLGKRGIGDAIETFPVFDMIKERWPDAELSVGCHGKSQELAVAMHPDVSSCIGIFKGSVKHVSKALKGFRQNYRSMGDFDIVVFLYKKKVSWPMLLAARFGGAKVHHKHDYHYRNSRQSAHSDFPEYVFCQIVASRLLGLPFSNLRRPRISVSPQAKTFATQFFADKGIDRGPKIIMNTRGNPTMSEWGVKNYALVANALARDGYTVIINGGSKVQIKEYQLVENSLADEVIVLDRPTPDELLGVINKCDLFIGEPSGPTCLAKAVGTPTITLQGPGEHGFPGQDRVGPTWWPRASFDRVISKTETCELENGTQCRCRYPQTNHGIWRMTLKRIGLWKNWKGLLKALSLYPKPKGSHQSLRPCLKNITIDAIVETVKEQIHPPCLDKMCDRESTVHVGKEFE